MCDLVGRVRIDTDITRRTQTTLIQIHVTMPLFHRGFVSQVI